jgi:uncharacterized protein YuzE
VRITYDSSVDAAYINLEAEDAKESFGYSYTCDPLLVDGQIHLNFDKSGRLIGIEVLQASKKMPKYILRSL